MKRKLKYKVFVCKSCGYTNTLQYKEALKGESLACFCSSCPQCRKDVEMDNLTSAEAMHEFKPSLISNNVEKDDGD